MTLYELGKRYPSGLYEFLFKYRSDFYQQLLGIEGKIDKAILSGTVDELKLVLREYWTLHMRAIHIFKNNEIKDFNREEVRREILDGRVSS